MASTRKSAQSKTPAKRRTRSKQSSAPTIGKTGFAALALTGVTAISALAFGLLRNRRTGSGDAGTNPTDLMQGHHPDGSERAIDAFRPDPAAPVPAAEREALRPALAGAAAPTLVKGQADALRRVDAAPS